MNNFLKFIEDTVYRGQCVDCSSCFPNDRTRIQSNDAMRAWRQRHQFKTGHSVRTAVTYVRRYN